MRTSSAEVTAGGKGVNVARACRSLGVAGPLVVFGGSDDLPSYTRLLRAEGADFTVSPRTGGIRVATIYLESASPRITIVNETGVCVVRKDWAAFVDHVGRLAVPGDFVLCMGSFPPGVTREDIAHLLSILHDRGARVLIDSAPEFLGYALSAGVDVVCPNLDEAEALLQGTSAAAFHGDVTEARVRAEAAATQLRERGARIAIITAGEAGVVVADENQTRFIPSPEINLVSAVGAGDSFVAGLVMEAEKQLKATGEIDWFLSAAFGAATAAASCETVQAGGLEVARVTKLHHEVLASINSLRGERE